MIKRMLWLSIDLFAAALVVLAVWIVNYKIPRGGIQAVTFLQAEAGSLMATHVVTDRQDWHEKFADKFTDTVKETDTSYTSPDLSIQLSYHHYDTGILDQSGEGKHVKYGTEVSYVLADIYVGDITCLRTAFARDTYGVGYLEKLSDMSSKMKSGTMSWGITSCCWWTADRKAPGGCSWRRWQRCLRIWDAGQLTIWTGDIAPL